MSGTTTTTATETETKGKGTALPKTPSRSGSPKPGNFENPGNPGDPRNPETGGGGLLPPPPSNQGEQEGRPRRRPQLANNTHEKRTIPKMGKKLDGQNFTAWAKSLKMLIFLYPVHCLYKYNVWHIICGDLLYNQEEFVDIQLDEDDWFEANYFALLTMKRNCEDEPLGLIELCEYAFEAYEILQTHYENRMVSDLGVIISGVTKSSYFKNITIEAHIQDFEQKWKKMATIGNVDEENQEFAEHIQGIGRLEGAKKEFLLMTFPTQFLRYAQLKQNLRPQRGYSYGDLVANLKIYVPQIGWKKKSQQGAWIGSKTDPLVLRTETGTRGSIDTSKICKYCIDVKGWRGIGHTERDCRTKKRERGNNPATGNSSSGVKKINSKPYEESEDDSELDQGPRITEIHANRRSRVNMIKAGRINNRVGQYEFDTGAQVHTTNELWRLEQGTLKPGRTITACHGTKTTAVHKGTLRMKHNRRDIILKNVLYHSTFYNLISGQRVKNVELKGDNILRLRVFTENEPLYAIDQDSNGTMWIKPQDHPPTDKVGGVTDTYVPVNKVTLMDLHERYGHISFDTLKTLPEAQKYHGKTAPKCEACIAGKSTKPAAKHYPETRSEQPLERLHADLIGPFKKQWLSKKYILTMMDDFSRYCVAIPIRAKSDTKEKVKEWISLLENQTPHKVQSIQADWGGEFQNHDLMKWCKNRGIELKETVPYHSETNAKIERLNRTLQDMARTAIIAAGKGTTGLWGDAIQWAAYTKNRIPYKSLRKTPIEALFNKTTNRSNLRPFGQKVMKHAYKDQRGGDRMTTQAIPAKIVGYTKTHGIYQVISDSGKRVLAKDPKPINQLKEDSDGEDNPEWPTKPIQDLEDIAKGHQGRNYGWHYPEKEGCPEETHVENHQETQTPKRTIDSPELNSPSQQLFREQAEPPATPTKPKAPEPRRSERMGRDTTNWQDRIAQELAVGPAIRRVGHDDDHPTDGQARTCPKAHEWAKAHQTEREKLQKYGVYTIVHQVPPGIQPVDTKWVYDVKKDSAGNITRYRARKVGRGFTQEYGINHDETFSQMARSESWRVLLAVAVNTPEWTVMQWDVKAAYRQGDLDHEIYVKDLKEDNTVEYWLLHKALYGLKQAGHQWYNRMRAIMTKTAGLTQCIGDPGCFYLLGLPGQQPKMVVSTHVDDMAGYGTLTALTTFEKAVESEVELEKLGRPTKLLGMELTWERDGSVKLTQQDSIGKLIKEHGIQEIPNKSIPTDSTGYSIPTETNNNEFLQDPTKYQSLVGSLLYINRMTRPDISLHVNLLGRRTSKPSLENLRTAQRLGQYLPCTKDEGLILKIKESPKFPDEKGVPIKLYADASYGGENSRSQSGSLVTLFGIPVMWNSRRQDVVSMSITEAEYIACSETAKDSQWLGQFLKELGMNPQPILHTDNEPALKLTKTQTFHRRTRHFEHRFHYVRELVDQKAIQITGIKGKNNPADPLTKLLPKSSIGRWKTEISIG